MYHPQAEQVPLHADDRFRANFLWGRKPMLAACAARLAGRTDLVWVDLGGGTGVSPFASEYCLGHPPPGAGGSYSLLLRDSLLPTAQLQGCRAVSSHKASASLRWYPQGQPSLAFLATDGIAD